MGRPCGRHCCALGLDNAERTALLRELAAYGPLSEEELASLAGAGTPVGSVLRWAELLRLADQGEEGWRLDPVAAALLQATEG